MSNPTDPAAFFREMLGQWEKVANGLGSDAMKTEEFARGMQGASAAGMTVQAAYKDMVEKALGASNMPTRADVEAIATRMTAIEASLARIEAILGTNAAPSGDKKKPTRGRKPPPGVTD